MKKYIFLSLTLILGLVACNSKPTPVDPRTKIEGRLMDKGTINPIPNTRVRLIEVNYSEPWSSTKRVIQSVSSDANGQFAFDFQWATGRIDYEVDARPNNLETYYEVSSTQSRIQQGQTNKVDCFLSPYGWINFKVKNTNPFNDKDTIRCYVGTFVGKNVDKTILYKTGKAWTRPDSIGWTVTKNSIAKSYITPVTIILKDTVTFEINY